MSPSTAHDGREDDVYLARAIALAERGRGTTKPNPLVGCVLVREGEIVGEGWHERAGQPHAEVRAIEDAGDAASGSTAYVSLEPCDHQGRTGPCSRALVDAGVQRVVYGLADPNPEARGGHLALAGAGVEVRGGVLASWVAHQNAGFVRAVHDRRPLVVLKIAQTVDGVVSLVDRRWITGDLARTEVHRLRAGCDAVLVGSGTVLSDDPRLDVRLVEAPNGQPRPVVLDARGRTPLEANVVRQHAIVVTAPGSPEGWRRGLSDRGVQVLDAPPGVDGGVSLPHALRALAEVGIQSILAEPGPVLTRALVEERLVDRLVLHVATDLDGGAGLVTVTPALQPAPDWRWQPVASGRLGPDFETVAVPVPVGA